MNTELHSKYPTHLGPWALDTVHCAESLEALRKLPTDSVDIVITSPPYWGQRGSSGIGIEADPREYLKSVTGILLEVMRVLAPHGVLWLNIGDSYNTPINWGAGDHKYSTLGVNKTGHSPENIGYAKNRGRRRAFIRKDVGWLQYGNLLALPYRIVLNICDAGFYFRGEVIWVKSKAMPEGKCRRPHRKHESIYILTKSESHSFRINPPVPSVWYLKYDANLTKHSSAFPIDLPATCIQATGIQKGIVLDPFMGIGTTALAAQREGLNFIGFDVDKRSVEIATQCIKEGTRNVLASKKPSSLENLELAL